jgi:Ala-tRNA(Pro) deacylase
VAVGRATYAKTRPGLQQSGLAAGATRKKPAGGRKGTPAPPATTRVESFNSQQSYLPAIAEPLSQLAKISCNFTDSSLMPATPHDLFAFLDSLGIAHKTVTHPPLFTVEQSQTLRGTIPGGHTKNLFLKDKKDAVFLVVAPEEGRVDLKTLHHKLGASRFSFGSAALLEELLGVSPGAVTAFGAINDKGTRVNVVVDASLMQHAVINCHPLTNTMTTSIGSGDLIKFLEATGHMPRIERVAEPA